MSKKKADRLRKNKKFIIFEYIFSILLILSSLVFDIVIFTLNILPLKYFIVLILFTNFFVFLFSLSLMNKKFKIWVKFSSILLSLIFMLIFLVGLYYINRTYDFLGKIKSKGWVIENYYIIVDKDSNLSTKNINEIEVFNETSKISVQALEELKKIKTFNIKEAFSIEKMFKDLTENEIEAIFISESHKELMESEFEEFSTLTKTIETIEVKIKDQVEHSDVNVVNEVFTIFLSGIDTNNLAKSSRSDVNMLITVNPNTHEVLLTSIPRDYYVQLHNTTGSKDKLTHAGFYGVNMSINTVEDLLDINIDYYVKVNFQTVLKLVDTIGGVDIISDKSLVTRNYNCNIVKGKNHLNGTCALGYMRERYAYIDGDRHRIKNQQDVLAALISKMTSSTAILTKYTSILSQLSSSLETNIETKDITRLVKLQLDKMPSWNVLKYSLNGTDSNDVTYSSGSQKLYVMIPNEETVKKAHEYIDGMEQGKRLSELGLE